MIPVSVAQLELWVAAFIWPFIRILALLSTAPIFESRSVPRRFRVGLSAILAIICMQLLPPPPTLSQPDAFLVLLQQIIVGVSMGFAMRLVFTAFEIAGDFLGLQMGLAFAQFIDPSKGNQTPLIGSYMSILASLVFLALDGHLLIIAAVIKSFDLVPISGSLGVVNTDSIARAGSVMFMLALQISLPVFASLVISNVILGILARAAPQLNVMSIGFSITISAGIWMLWVSLPYFIAGLDSAIARILEISILKSAG